MLGWPFGVVPSRREEPNLYTPASVGCPLLWKEDIALVLFSLVNPGSGLTAESCLCTPTIWEMSFIFKGDQGGISQHSQRWGFEGNGCGDERGKLGAQRKAVWVGNS